MLDRFRQGAPLYLATLLFLSACDDPPDEKPVVKVKQPAGVKVEIEIEEKKDESVITPDGIALATLLSGLLLLAAGRKRVRALIHR
jgi:hypothetical protein